MGKTVNPSLIVSIRHLGLSRLTLKTSALRAGPERLVHAA